MNITTLDTYAGASVAYSASTAGLDIGPEVEWEPEHLASSAWLEHVPFAFWLMKVLQPDCFVELGTERGVSYAAFCQAVDRLGIGARCYAVDTWQGDEHAGHYDESVFTQLVELNERRYRRFSSLLRTTFAEALPYFADGEVDLLHIDGLHTYDAVAEDFATWRPKLSDRGVVLFHDTNVRRDDFGVWRLWRKLRTEHPSFEFVHGYGLGIIGVGERLPAPLRALFDHGAHDDLRRAIRGVFASRGTAVFRAQTLQSLTQQSLTQQPHGDGRQAQAANEQMQAADQRAAAAEQRAAAAEQRAAAAEQPLQAAEQQVAALAGQVAALQAETAALRSQALALHGQHEAAQAAATAAQTALADARQQLAAQEAAAEALRQQVAAANGDAAELGRRFLSEAAEAREELVRRTQLHAEAMARSASVEAELRALLADSEAQRAALRASTSWRITAPLRAVKTAVAEAPEAKQEQRRRRFGGLAGRSNGNAPATAAASPARLRVLPPASQVGLLQLRVLIVAELSVLQCKKYRVDQKHDMIEALGWDCTVIGWQDTDRVMSLLQTHSVVIFYRVPAFPDVLKCIDEAAALGLPHYFELDDLIFDIDDYAANPNLTSLDAATAKGLFEGAVLYRDALRRCRNIIASTPYLSDRMQAAGGGSAMFIENALDKDTMRAAVKVRRADDGKVRIFYGSGTRTHDADLALVAPALKRVAREFAKVEIVLVGELNPGEELLSLGAQLRQLPSFPYAEYLGLLATADIAIAPLSAVKFNEAKSNIKFLEAAAAGVPSVCSPRSAFTQAIRPSETGLLAEGVDDWYAALKLLVTKPALRARIGEAARDDVLKRYSPDAIGQRQLRPLLAQHVPAADKRLHVLQVNILFKPQSFGGATIVMEAVTEQLRRDPNTRLSVVTTAPLGWIKPDVVERGEEDGVTVFRIGLQDVPGWAEEPWGEKTAEAFRDILRALRPDVVHFHAVQGIGAASLEACRAEAIPYVVTLHDAWWVCERQFLVTGEGKYCGQQTISMNICAGCVPNITNTVIRNLRLRQALEGAARLLTPTEHWRRFYVANGFDAQRVGVNQNGVELPVDPPPNQGPARLRFGFVAGAEPVKGFPLLKRCFEALERDDWELVLVNHGLAIGTDSYEGVTWAARGTITVVPPFAAAGRDAFYRSIDVLLFPSQWPESFGLTVREALTRNKWVIATDRGGAAEAIEPGVNGTLIPITEDIGPLRQAVTDLLDRKPDLANWVNPSVGQVRDFAAQAVELRQVLAGVAETARKERFSRQRPSGSAMQAAIAAAPRSRPRPPAGHANLLRPRVLLVAELSLPPLRKYRVDQKRDMIEALGWDCTVVSWREHDRATSLIQTHSVVIFYRLPGYDAVLRMVQEAETLGVPRYYELDDLIFDISDFAANPNLLGLEQSRLKGLFEGVPLYRRTLEACRSTIASTPYLAERMQAVGGGRAVVVENALDDETIQAAAAARRRAPDGKVRIMYGSGSPTHDADFALMADVLKRVLQENADAELLLVGELSPPKALQDLGPQLQRRPACPYLEYLGLLAESDISIAPLIAANFNQAKSNIKFLEAAAVGVPSVCSPRSAFSSAVEHGETGFLAESKEEWYAALTALVRDPALRQRIGEQARQSVLDRYSPQAIGRRQVEPLLAPHRPADDRRLHVLQVNVLCSPQTFGGATVIMEEMTRRLSQRADTRVSIFTSAPPGWLKPYELERDAFEGVPVFRVGIQDDPTWVDQSWDERAAEAFNEVLRAIRPDVVHFHAVQGLGATTLRVCHETGVPYVVTLHDAWWLCQRQFLVTGEGRYCGQKEIDMKVCATCVPDLGQTVPRNLRLRQVLETADLLLTPSQHWRRFHIANRFDPERLVVNENGVPMAAAAKPNTGPARLRFGFVAGAEPVKGFPLLKRSFEALERDDWELVLVNHGLEMGVDSFAEIDWRVHGTIRMVPPFHADSRDTFYETIDVLLFPSQWPESFGLTVREALVRNKWVIATDQGGAAEAIRPGVNGTLIPIGEDVAPLRQALEDLLDRKPDLAGWVNPTSGQIRNFDAQAEELRGILADVVARAAAVARGDALIGQAAE